MSNHRFAINTILVLAVGIRHRQPAAEEVSARKRDAGTHAGHRRSCSWFQCTRH